MKHLCKFFHLLTLFFLLLTLILASSAFAQVVPTDAGQPRGTIPRITKNTNVTKISSNSSSVFSQAIGFVVKSVIAYGTTYIVERIVSKLFRKCRAEVHPQQKCVHSVVSVVNEYEINERKQ